MARLQGITGGLSGKMGSTVFRQRGGETIASQYQPIIKNPNSEGQQAQRAKFKLMSQLAAIMAEGFGTMSVTKRAGSGRPSQRNAFVQKNFGLVTVADDASGVTARIPMEQLQLTSSFRALPTPTLTVLLGRGFEVSMENNVPSEVSIVRVVLVGYTSNGVTQAEIQEIVDVPVENGSISHDFLVPLGKYTVLAYGLIPSESALSSIDLDNIHTPADEEFISAVKLNAMVLAGQMAETMTVGANVEVVSE